MLKGVNHRVVEIPQPESMYFEKVLFFVKPEFSDINEKRLRAKADGLIKDAAVPSQKKSHSDKKKKILLYVKLMGAALAGALAASLGLISALS